VSPGNLRTTTGAIFHRNFSVIYDRAWKLTLKNLRSPTANKLKAPACFYILAFHNLSCCQSKLSRSNALPYSTLTFTARGS